MSSAITDPLWRYKMLLPAVEPSSLLTGLVHYWKLEDAVDTITSDTATTVGSAAYNAGKVNNGLFLGSDVSYLDTVAGIADLSTDFTVAGWVKQASDANYHIFWGNDDGASGWQIRGTDSDTTQLMLNGTLIATGSNIYGAAWKHVTVTFDRAAKQFVVYFDTVSNMTYTHGSTPGTTANTFSIGNWKTNALYKTTGVDELGVWSRVLSSEEIALHYNSGTGRTHPF